MIVPIVAASPMRGEATVMREDDQDRERAAGPEPHRLAHDVADARARSACATSSSAEAEHDRDDPREGERREDPHALAQLSHHCGLHRAREARGDRERDRDRRHAPASPSGMVRSRRSGTG